MNKQELIKRISELPYSEGPIADTVTVNRNWILGSIEQLDEPQKQVVPQFVADWINYCKITDVDLYHAFEMSDLYLGNYAYQKDYPKLKGYFKSENNQEKFALAWVNGYEVEKEKKYTVKIKGKIEENLLVYGWGINRYFFARTYNDSSKRGEHTRKELEEDGFGKVFDSPQFEVEEVTE